MDTEKRNKLRRQIQIAASLTQHQAGKVTGAVLTILGGAKVEKALLYANRRPEDCAIAVKCKIRPNCAGCLEFIPVKNMSESHGPTVKETPLKKHNDSFAEDTDSKEIIRQTQAELPRSKSTSSYVKRKPENCAKDCNGPLCEGCPIWEPMTLIQRLDNMEGPADVEQPPFELDEEEMGHGVLVLEDVKVKPGSVILTPQEFELIRNQLQGAVKSSINEKINRLRKHMDKPEKVKEMLQELLVVLELSFRLDKMK